jgi:amino acid transporter
MNARGVRENIANIVIGKPLETSQVTHQTASNPIALAVLASDALSSVAYATEEILIILNTAAIGSIILLGFQGNGISIPIAISIALLITIVTISYRQTIFSNPAGGGGYRVAKENLGEELAQVTAAAILTDYILTVAVSISAGVANVASVFPELVPYRVQLTIAVITVIALLNLRGLKESARLFAVPTYFFLFMMAVTLMVGFFKMFTGTLNTVTGVDPIHHTNLESLSILLILRAFSSGCTALTGIEAISNGTQIFRPPRAKNAATTLAIMSTMLISLFLSITVLANAIQAVPSHHETIISQLARTIYGEEGFGYVGYVMTIAGAFAILFMAANTPFADFPQVAALSSTDGFLPRQLTYRGRRLVYARGIITLAISSIFVVIITGAVVTNLIPLYAIGVFLTFTISKAGMMRRFWRAGHLKPGEVAYGLETKIEPDPNWIVKFLISALGSLVTFIVMVVFIITKFTSGAWFIVLLIPLMVWIFFGIHRHYKETAAKLKLEHVPTFNHQPVVFDPAEHTELGIYFCDTWSKLAVTVVGAILKRGIPIKIIHVNVDEKRANAFLKRSKEIVAQNGWSEEDIIYVRQEPYRDLYKNISDTLQEMRAAYPNVHFDIYIGGLRTRFPYSLLHMSTDRFLSHALIEVDEISLTVKQVELDKLPLPEGFKVTFEHVVDHHFSEDVIASHEKHS